MGFECDVLFSDYYSLDPSAMRIKQALITQLLHILNSGFPVCDYMVTSTAHYRMMLIAIVLELKLTQFSKHDAVTEARDPRLFSQLARAFVKER